MQSLDDMIGSRDETTIEPCEVLAFRLGREEYGIDIQKVNELRGYENVTRIANTPEFVKGVINLRGIIVPIIDMRIKFELGTPIYDEFTVVVILRARGCVIGMVVDSVSDVIALTSEQMRPMPPIQTMEAADFLTGIGSIDQRTLILLDIEKLMSGEEMGLPEKIAA